LKSIVSTTTRYNNEAIQATGNISDLVMSETGEMLMTYGNLWNDMQLYMVGQQVKWFEPDKFTNVILHPLALLFFRCFGILIQGEQHSAV